MTPKLGVLASHPIQYQAPLFRELARQVDLHVFFAMDQSAAGQARAGFGVPFNWDVDLLSGYRHSFLRNRARRPDVSRFWGCDTPEIEAAIARENFDAFLVTGWALKSYWQAIRACRRHGVPVLVRGDSHLGSPRGWGKRIAKSALYPFVLRRFDACLYVGQRNREYLLHYGVPAARLFFSPHCVDNERFAAAAQRADRSVTRAAWGLDAQSRAVLFAGKLVPVKRPLDFLQGVRMLRESHGVAACAVIAGDGPLRGVLEAQAREWGVPVTFLGFRNQSELPAIYAASDVLVLPSVSETWGLVVNEALACGTPVVVSDSVGCAQDLVHRGRTGVVYPSGDVHALAEGLQDVLRAPPPPNAMKAAIDSYSAQASAKGILEALSATAPSRRE